MINTITDIIAIITVAQLLLFALFLLSAKKDRTPDKIALALFLLANGFFILDFLSFRYTNLIIPFSVNLFFIGNAFGFLFGPLLYLYTKAVTSKDFQFLAKDILHLIPFAIVFCMILFLYQFQSYEVKLELLKTDIFDATGFTIYFISMQVVIFTYLLISYQIARKKNKNLKSYFSSIEKINFDWLKLVVTAFCVMWVVDIINWTLYILNANTAILMQFLGFISLLINFIFANLLILKSLKLPQIDVDRENGIEKPKYVNSPLSDHEKDDILTRLENLMANEKLYLNSSLNLGETARHLNIAPRYLSQVINELKEQNFYDYVNGYRINEAMRILIDPNHESDKIISVQLDCGFNSKSVFNTVFKKITGVTPSEYRKINLVGVERNKMQVF